MQVSDSISTLLSELIGGPTSSKCSCWAFPENGWNLTLAFETHSTKNVSFSTTVSMHKLTTKWPLGPTMTPRVFRAWKTKLPATIWHEFNKFGHWFLLKWRHAVFSSDWIWKSANTPPDQIQFALSRKNNNSTCVFGCLNRDISTYSWRIRPGGMRGAVNNPDFTSELHIFNLHILFLSLDVLFV